MKIRQILRVKKSAFKTSTRRIWIKEKSEFKKKKAKTWSEAVRERTNYIKLPRPNWLFFWFWMAFVIQLVKKKDMTPEESKQAIKNLNDFRRYFKN